MISLDLVLFMFYGKSMDWDFSIERNREPLLRHVLGLFALIGLVEGGMVDRLSRPVYRRALTVLKSAESAVRRLIIVMARDIKVEPRPKRPMRAGLLRSRKGTFQSKSHGRSGSGQGQKPRRPVLHLVRPAKALRCRPGSPPPAQRAAGVSPAFISWATIREFRSSFWPQAPAPTPAPQQVETVKDYTVSAKRLCRRLFAILGALTNMEREVERYARWLAQPERGSPPTSRKSLTLRLAAGLAHQVDP